MQQIPIDFLFAGYYYLIVDETGWKDIADLVNLIYGSIQLISAQK